MSIKCTIHLNDGLHLWRPATARDDYGLVLQGYQPSDDVVCALEYAVRIPPEVCRAIAAEAAVSTVKVAVLAHIEPMEFCPRCGQRLDEVLTSAPPKCGSCRRSLGVYVWIDESQRAEFLAWQARERQR